MKKLKIMGGVCLALGFAIATGIDANPIQALYALLLMGAAWVCFHAVDEYEAELKNERKHDTTEQQASIEPTNDYKQTA